MNLHRGFQCAALLALLGARFLVAADTDYYRRSLVGLRGVQVIVEPLRPEAEARGLTTALLQTDAELRLRKAGIRVLTRQESEQAPGNPYLYVNVAITTGSIYWGDSLHVSLRQTVLLERDTAVRIDAETWDASSGGGIYLPENIAQKVRGAIDDLVDQFVNAYLAANPK